MASTQSPRSRGLVDQFGNPVDTSKLTQEEAAPAMIGVRSIISAHPSVGLTPQRLANLLREAETGDPTRYLELAEDMEEKDLHYAGVLGTRKRGVAQLQIAVEAAGEDAESQKHADAVRAFLRRDELQEELFDILDAIGKGYSAIEIIWAMSGSEWTPARLEWRDPRWFMPSLDDGRTLFLRDGTQWKPLTPFKYIVHRPKIKSGIPIRGGLARLAAWAYLFKNYALKDWVSFAEVFGQPYRVGKYEANATPDDKAALLRAVANIGSDAAAIIPTSMLIEFIEAGRSGSIDLYEKLSRFLDEQVSKGVLGQTTTTEVTQGGGSRALGQVHADTKQDIQTADAIQLSATLNRDLVRPYVDLNYGPQKAYPKLVIGLPDELTTMQKLMGLRLVVPMGVKVAASAARDLLGFEEPGKDEELLTMPPAGAAGPEPSLQAQQPRGAGSRARAIRAAIQAADPSLAPDAIDELVRETLADDGWQPMMDPMLQPLRELLDRATSIEDVRTQLAALVGDMDVTALEQLLGDEQFVTRLAGAIGVEVAPEAALDGVPSGVNA